MLGASAAAAVTNDSTVTSPSALFDMNTTDTALFANATISSNSSANFLLDLLDENNMIDSGDNSSSNNTDMPFHLQQGRRMCAR